MKRIVKIFGRTALVVLVLLALLVGWAYTFEDEIKAKALAELQAGLTTDMQVGAIEYSVVRSFPYVSLECRNILLKGTFSQEDTLVNAEVLSFDIALLELVRGDVTFRSITLKDGFLNLRRGERGTGNYLIWKSDTTASTGKSAFDVERLVFSNVGVRYDDRLSDVFVSAVSLDALFGGSLEGASLAFDGELDTPSLHLEASGTVWVDEAPVKGSLSSGIDTDKNVFGFHSVDLRLAGLDLGGELTVESDGPTMVAGRIDVNARDLNKARVLIPGPYRSVLDGYELGGSAAGQLALSGSSDRILWDVNFTLDNAELEHSESGASLDRMNGKFTISGGADREGELTIERSEARLGSGRVVVNGRIRDFQSPSMQLNLEGDLRLEDLVDLTGVSKRIMAEGRVAVEIGFAGRWPVVRNDTAATIDPDLLRQSRYNGVAELTGVSFSTREMPRAVEDLNGRLKFEGDHATVKELRFKMADSDLNVSGTLSNVLPWVLTKDEVLEVNAQSTSKRIDLNGLLAANEPTSEEEAYAFVLPNNLDLQLETRVDELVFRNFSATGITGSVELNKSGLRVNPMRFSSCEGNVNLEMAVTPAAEGFRVSAAGVLASIDIRKLFFSFEEFGQEFLTSANLRGACEVDAVFSATMSETLDLDRKSIASSIDLTVENGELIGLQSLNDISAYMRDNKLISPFIEVDRLEESMRHIRFETLENRIEIKDERIYFPMMDVASSAINIKASGAHWFDNRIDYSVGLYLRDILVRKDRTEFGEVEDDGLGSRFFLAMTGTVDDPQFRYDRDAKKELRKEERRAEREILKQILKEDLNPFRKRDKESNEDERPAGNASSITVDWGDESPANPVDKSSANAKKASPQDSTKRRWRIGRDKKEETEAPPPDDDDDF